MEYQACNDAQRLPTEYTHGISALHTITGQPDDPVPYLVLRFLLMGGGGGRGKDVACARPSAWNTVQGVIQRGGAYWDSPPPP